MRIEIGPIPMASADVEIRADRPDGPVTSADRIGKYDKESDLPAVSG